MKISTVMPVSSARPTNSGSAGCNVGSPPIIDTRRTPSSAAASMTSAQSAAVIGPCPPAGPESA
ncbi:hypothetical protein CcI156_08310 [Frankia sp. CcI156]|nr:hypothetical protein Manayef4_17525 [Frankia sp. CgIM4]OHV56699.1 hypothetical protein CgIS1_08635 [Frankia sp. CgIS1]ONH27445.1 hypothetical protein CcI156_08310 [Frankia sp. CcI156]